MARTFEYNHDGSYHIIEDNPDGSLTIHHNQDVSAAVNWATKQRNSGQNDYGGLRDRNDLKHFATVPMGAILSMRDEGIDFWNKDHEKDMLKWLQNNAPKCLVTNRKIV